MIPSDAWEFQGVLEEFSRNSRALPASAGQRPRPCARPRPQSLLWGWQFPVPGQSLLWGLPCLVASEFPYSEFH